MPDLRKKFGKRPKIKMKSISRLPPPPQQINDYLNGHIIGHYVMKKALSVAIYNHYSNITVARYVQNSHNTINSDASSQMLTPASSLEYIVESAM